MATPTGEPRRVPEAAVLVGVLLSASLIVFLLAVSPRRFLEPAFSLSVLLAAVAVSYPFYAYAVVHDDDPTTVFPPRVVGAIGIGIGTAAAVVGALSRIDWTPLVALAAGLPPVAYAIAYGDDPTPVRPVPVALGGLAAAGLLSIAGGTGAPAPPAWIGSAVLLAGSAGAYYRWSGRDLPASARYAGVATVAVALGAAVAIALGPGWAGAALFSVAASLAAFLAGALRGPVG